MPEPVLPMALTDDRNHLLPGVFHRHNLLMAWEWVAPVSTAGAGGLGVFFTWLTSWQGRRHAETISRDQQKHARDLSREQREQQRLETAYIQMLIEAERMGNWATSVHPMYGPNAPVVDMPSLDEQATTAAHVNAFGSAPVKRLMQAWRDVVSEMAFQAALITPSGFVVEDRSQDMEARKEIFRLRPKERRARLALADQVATELRIPADELMFTDRKKFPMKVMQDD
ncbi:Uncharacterised protein [Mycobacteroides abscessus subsp. massiliense]|nr:Uncharacterised protein [Mycobacteroides abscessus subsp. massiliense]